jgi:hypothetical protein
MQLFLPNLPADGCWQIVAQGLIPDYEGPRFCQNLAVGVVTMPLDKVQLHNSDPQADYSAGSAFEE